MGKVWTCEATPDRQVRTPHSSRTSDRGRRCLCELPSTRPAPGTRDIGPRSSQDVVRADPLQPHSSAAEEARQLNKVCIVGHRNLAIQDPRRGGRIGGHEFAEGGDPAQQPALFPHPRDGRGESRGDLPLPRMQPAGGVDRPPPVARRLPRPRPQRQPRGPREATSPSTTCRYRCCGRPSPTGPPFQILETPTP
jgi:hypothetical protein